MLRNRPITAVALTWRAVRFSSKRLYAQHRLLHLLLLRVCNCLCEIKASGRPWTFAVLAMTSHWGKVVWMRTINSKSELMVLSWKRVE